MRAALHALTDELKRLKSAGVREVSVSEESLVALRRAVRAYSAGATADRATGRVAEGSVRVVENAVKSSATLSAPSPKANISPAAPEQAVSTPSLQKSDVPPAKPASRPIVSVAKVEVATLPPPPTVALAAGDKQTRWNALLAQVTNDPVCRAHVRPGKKVVLGVGNLDAKIFFCGEAPGAEEEEKGEPFVGPAGQLLTRMIQGMGLSRAEVYIGNIMNWRPELPVGADGVQVGNRPPTTEELAYCLPYLKAQLEVVNPDVIVALGSTAAQGLLGAGSFKTLGEIRSQWKPFAGKPVMVTYHPSYILRNPTNRSKRAIWEDLLKVMERVALPISEKQRTFFLDK